LNNRDSLSINAKYEEIKYPIKIIYAGNIGLGQGLEMVIFPLAKHYNEKILFQLIGDGSSVNLIQKGIIDNEIENIQLIAPVNRDKLLKYYNEANVLFLHLNNISSFEKVLPSKIFDYGSFDKHILAGVDGIAHTFIKKNLPNAYLFKPGDYKSMIKIIDHIIDEEQPLIDNSLFVEEFSRKKIINSMLDSMISDYSTKYQKYITRI
jgi:hypothetical protein